MEVKIPIPTREELEHEVTQSHASYMSAEGEMRGFFRDMHDEARNRLAIFDAVMAVTDTSICGLTTHLERALSFDLDRAFLYNILTRRE